MGVFKDRQTHTHPHILAQVCREGPKLCRPPGHKELDGRGDERGGAEGAQGREVSQQEGQAEVAHLGAQDVHLHREEKGCEASCGLAACQQDM